MANGSIEPLIAAHLDLVNMFGNAGQSCARTFWSPRPGPSGHQCHLAVLGTIQSALVLGHARGTHTGEYVSNPLEAKGVCDERFVDDGQVFVRSWSFNPWLRALDAALASFGATRGCAAHGNVKSSARLLCPPERMSEFVAWDTPYVQDTVTVLSSVSGTTALGSAFGSREHVNARAWESVRACDEMRSAIVSVDRAPTEMVLTRQCADVSKLMYHTRINGDMLDQDLLAAFGGQLRVSVTASLCGDLRDHSWWQATTPSHGLLGEPHHVLPPGLHHGRPLQPRL